MYALAASVASALLAGADHGAVDDGVRLLTLYIITYIYIYIYICIYILVYYIL